jgi:hypothetical protein
MAVKEPSENRGRQTERKTDSRCAGNENFERQLETGDKNTTGKRDLGTGRRNPKGN